MIFSILLLVTSAFGADFLVPHDLSLEYQSFFHKGRDPMFSELDNREPGSAVALNLGIDVLGPVYWDQTIHTETDRQIEGQGSQFRTVGWKFELGLKISPQVDFFYQHHSQHLLDATSTYGFPVLDGVGIRLNIIKDKPRGSILP